MKFFEEKEYDRREVLYEEHSNTDAFYLVK